MKKIILFSLFLIFAKFGYGQCNMQNYLTTPLIQLAQYPYTNANAITVSASAPGVPTLQNFTYNCGGNAFAGASPTWWLNAASQTITLTFSQPVCNFTVLVNGTNLGEVFYFNSNNGTISLQNFCSDYSVQPPGNALIYNATSASGTIITVDNPAGATIYYLTHNGTGSGSRISLLDCYVGCIITPPTNTLNCNVVDLFYCPGDQGTVTYTATGSYNVGNIFTAQLSDALGSFASPTNIGSLVSTSLTGSIPITIPPTAAAGTAYRIRVNSSSPFQNGNDNGTDITVYPKPTVTANAVPTNICAGENTTLTGGGANTYTWTGGVINAVPFSPSSSNTYTVTGTDGNGCTHTSAVSILVNPLPIVSANSTPASPICAGESITLSGSGALSYSWTNGVSNNVAFVPNATNTYTVTGTDANNCSNTATIQIVVNPLPILNIAVNPNDSICNGDMVTLTASGTNNYAWTNGISNGVAFSPNATTVYTVTGTDANGCTSSATQNITVNPKPVVNLGPDYDKCVGDSVVLNATQTNPNANYYWQNASTNPTYTAKFSGTYWVQVNIGNCFASDTMKLNIHPFPNSYLGADTTICQGESITLDVSCPNCNYYWTTNETTSSINANTTGYYGVTVNNGFCTSSDTMKLNVTPLPKVDLGPDTAICIGDMVFLDVYKSGASYLWQDLSTKSSYTITAIGNYWVEVTRNGCTGYDAIFVDAAKDCACNLALPNAFTPNADTKNDVLRLLNLKGVELEYFKIYNRWGENVFTTFDPSIGWDGQYLGTNCEVGTYYFVVVYKCSYTGAEKVLKGDVNLIR